MIYIVKVWDEVSLYEYEYGCIEHALKHIEVEKGCAKLYRYSDGVETAVEGVAKTFVNTCIGGHEKILFKAPEFCKRKR